MAKTEKSDSDGAVRRSIAVRLIRHAESRNNQVYRDARHIYRGGTLDYDEEGWLQYVHSRRSPDPSLSEDKGVVQAEKLADHLVPHLLQQASHPVRFIVSPMRRALETIRPTIQGIEAKKKGSTRVKIHAEYAESEGCHDRDEPREGMNKTEISNVLCQAGETPLSLSFESFPDPERGWWYGKSGSETRAESEIRAAKFYLWLNEYLDHQMQSDDGDIFDAGVAVPGEEKEKDRDYAGRRQRKRRMVLLVGHGDFMSLVLKRIVAGYGHYVEEEGSPHRSAFTHHNTGITELEYFGDGRYLIMGHNCMPHLASSSDLLSGGSLKDGWSYLVPNDKEDVEMSTAFADELEDHVREQTRALKSLYLSSSESGRFHLDPTLTVDEHESEGRPKHFIANRGLQVVGMAAYSDATGCLYGMAVKPSESHHVWETIVQAVRDYSRQHGRSGSLLVVPNSAKSKSIFESLGFKESEDEKVMETSLS